MARSRSRWFRFWSCAVRGGFVFGAVLGVGPLASVGDKFPLSGLIKKKKKIWVLCKRAPIFV